MDEEQLHLRGARLRAYNDGKYTLSEYEGFECGECGWRGLTAPMADEFDEDGVIVQCPECEAADPSTAGAETDWDEVREKVPDSYLP